MASWAHLKPEPVSDHSVLGGALAQEEESVLSQRGGWDVCVSQQAPAYSSLWDLTQRPRLPRGCDLPGGAGALHLASVAQAELLLAHKQQA